MAFIYDKATLTPGKLELLNEWLPSQPWFTSDAPVTKLDAYRFDDPEGEVGMEAFLLLAGDAVFHVPVTYRGAPLDGAERFLIGNTEHSELGTRWVYDGTGDPVWASALVTTILTGGSQAELVVEAGGELTTLGSCLTVTGSGTPGTPVAPITALATQQNGPLTTIGAGPYRLSVVRIVGTAVTAAQTLSGRWANGSGVLAGVSPA